ncbi:MAG: hypothetical protein ACP5N6_14660 [Anaerolineae bacterium]
MRGQAEGSGLFQPEALWAGVRGGTTRGRWQRRWEEGSPRGEWWLSLGGLREERGEAGREEGAEAREWAGLAVAAQPAL